MKKYYFNPTKRPELNYIILYLTKKYNRILFQTLNFNLSELLLRVKRASTLKKK